MNERVGCQVGNVSRWCEMRGEGDGHGCRSKHFIAKSAQIRSIWPALPPIWPSPAYPGRFKLALRVDTTALSSGHSPSAVASPYPVAATFRA